jgi:death-on-curing protein
VTYYPTVDDVLAAHARLIAKFGGSLGLRDQGALEHAVARPQQGYYADLIEEAATLWESLSQNHPFVDGNQRTAIAVTAAFLKVNGYRLEFNDLDECSSLIDLYESGSMRFATPPEWEAVRNNLDPDRPPGDKVEAWLREHAEDPIG